jgi:ABC-type maltose transport system permease subunit
LTLRVPTAPSVLARFLTNRAPSEAGQFLGAGVMISTVPVAILFTFFQRDLTGGLTAGALKG